MKTKIILLLALSCVSSLAQYYTNSTKLLATNTIAAASTNTYVGTNVFDATRWRYAQVSTSFRGSGSGSNWVFQSFVGGPDGTNWDYTSIYVLGVQAQGTNQAFGMTRFDWDTVGYIKPFQQWTTNANDITNVSTFVWTKTVPRN